MTATAIATRIPVTTSRTDGADWQKLVAYEAGRIDCHHVEAGTLLGVQDAEAIELTITPDLGMYATIAEGEISLRFTHGGIEVSEGPRPGDFRAPLWPHSRLDEADTEAQADVLAQVLAALRLVSTRRNGKAVDSVAIAVTFTDGTTAGATYTQDGERRDVTPLDRLAALCFTA